MAFIGLDRPLLALANIHWPFIGLHWITWAVGIFFLVKKYKTSNLTLLANWENSSWFEFRFLLCTGYTKGFLLITNPIWICPQVIGCFDNESISSFIEGSSGFKLKCKNQRVQMFCLWFFHLYSNPYQSSVFAIPFPSKLSNQILLGNWDNWFFMVSILWSSYYFANHQQPSLVKWNYWDFCREKKV